MSVTPFCMGILYSCRGGDYGFHITPHGDNCFDLQVYTELLGMVRNRLSDIISRDCPLFMCHCTRFLGLCTELVVGMARNSCVPIWSLCEDKP